MEFSGEQFDVIVIGAGVMGSSTAYQTAKQGQKTLLLEQFDFLHHLGSSHGESRTTRTTYTKPYYSSMVVESNQLWREAESEVGFKVYYKSPHLVMGPSDNKNLLAIIANGKENSSVMPDRVLDKCQVNQEFSAGIEMPEDWTAVLSEFGGVIKPTKAVSMFQTLAVKHGALLRDNMEVVDITMNEDDNEGGIFVHTINGQRIWGKKCVVTVGAWMKKLVEKLKSGFILPIQPTELTVCYWKIKAGHEADFTIEGGFPTFSTYGKPSIYGTPSLEFPGLIKILVDEGKHIYDPDNRTWTGAEKMLMESLREWIKGTFGDRVDSTGPVLTQSCLYSMTPDKDYVIDFLGGEFGENVVIAGGFSGHGFKMAPVVGKLLADLALLGVANGVEIEHFRLERFMSNPKGN